MTKTKTYKKGEYTGYIGSVFGDGKTYGYHIKVLRKGSPVARPKENFKTQQEAIDKVRKVIKQLDAQRR